MDSPSFTPNGIVRQMNELLNGPNSLLSKLLFIAIRSAIGGDLLYKSAHNIPQYWVFHIELRVLSSIDFTIRTESICNLSPTFPFILIKGESLYLNELGRD